MEILIFFISFTTKQNSARYMQIAENLYTSSTLLIEFMSNKWVRDGVSLVSDLVTEWVSK